jgi:hypothetical protein
MQVLFSQHFECATKCCILIYKTRLNLLFQVKDFSLFRCGDKSVTFYTKKFACFSHGTRQRTGFLRPSQPWQSSTSFAILESLFSRKLIIANWQPCQAWQAGKPVLFLTPGTTLWFYGVIWLLYFEVVAKAG